MSIIRSELPLRFVSDSTQIRSIDGGHCIHLEPAISCCSHAEMISDD